MAVTWNNPISNNQTVSSTTNSSSYDAGSGSNRVLTFHVATQNTTPSTGATYGGIACTKSTEDHTSFISEIYTLIGPASGANTLTVTWATAQKSYVDIAYATNASGVGVAGSSVGGVTSSPTVTMTTTQANSGIFIGMSSNVGTSITDNSGQSRLTSNTSDPNFQAYTSTKTEASTGSHSYGYTSSSTQECVSAVEILLATATAILPLKPLLGVGI